jgi:DNA-binding transcriptional MerR regulator
MQETLYERKVAPRLKEIKKMAGAGMSLTAISKALGISETSLVRYRRKYPDLTAILPTEHVQKNRLDILSPGRPKTPEDVKLAFRAHTKEALEVLVRIMQDEEQKASDRLKAAEAILDRGWGKPYQAIQLDEQQEKKVQVEFAPEMKEWLG